MSSAHGPYASWGGRRFAQVKSQRDRFCHKHSDPKWPFFISFLRKLCSLPSLSKVGSSLIGLNLEVSSSDNLKNIIVICISIQDHNTISLVILKPDKGNGVVVLDRIAYDNGILKIINDTSKSRPIRKDPTLLREGRLRRFLRKLLKNGHLDRCVYVKIYPSGSQPARIYGLPKIHKAREPNAIPPFHSVVSSIGT